MTEVLKSMELANHEQIVFCQDKPSGLKAIIAIHNTTLGPSLGGCRMYPYATEADALKDVLRLSRGMTYKSAISDMNFGGGKSVIIGDPKKEASELLLRTFGRFVQSLNGRYITAEDVGIGLAEVEKIRIETRHVIGLPTHIGGLGDPSPVTAFGVFVGIKASLKKLTGSDDLTGKKVAIQGLGHVGYHLCKELYNAGAILYVTDLNKDAIKKTIHDFKATVVEPDEIYGQPVDVFAPCAMGGILNDTNIPQLKCSIVAGAANNQLDDEIKHSLALKERGILYAPDYVINAGGLINVAAEFFRVKLRDYVFHKTEEIYDRLLNIYRTAETRQITPAAAAGKLAEERIYAIGQCKSLYARRGDKSR
jgi:leucine dehydrogenase